MVTKINTIREGGKIGQIFTPNYIAKFIVKNLFDFIPSKVSNPQTLRILEPSAGEGVFIKFLLKNGFSDITAYEMDSTLKNSLVKLYPSVKFKFDNFLGSDLNEKFDIIIGNPPYLGQNYNAEIFQNYVRKYPICARYFVGNMDLFYFFIHLGIEKLNPGGLLTYITTNYWITKSQKTGIKLLKPHILDECFLLQYIDLSNLNIFEAARGQHNCIFVLQKKTEQEKIKKINKDIQIIQTVNANNSQKIGELQNKKIFRDLIQKVDSRYLKKYFSALTNNNLQRNHNWNLIYPKEVKEVVTKIENYCKKSRKVLKLQDYFIIRNGLILVNDNIFILKEGKDLKIENNSYYVQINGEFIKLNEFEKERLKKIYKSKSIKSYGYNNDSFIGYLLYFNKSEFNQQSLMKRKKSLEEKYPTLTKYLKQFEKKLRKILINAKENPEDFYYPRRGSFIRRTEEDGKDTLVDLEPFYDDAQKIFFKFISNENIFGYSHDSYYATSDTYFLWPLKNKNTDYLFTLAYLNSKLVYFLYKAKNIVIKRSKTKLEHDLTVPNLKAFESTEKKGIVDLIRTLSFLLINNNENDHAINTIQNIIDTLFFKLFDLDEIILNNLLSKYYNLPLN